MLQETLFPVDALQVFKFKSLNIWIFGQCFRGSGNDSITGVLLRKMNIDHVGTVYVLTAGAERSQQLLNQR